MQGEVTPGRCDPPWVTPAGCDREVKTTLISLPSSNSLPSSSFKLVPKLQLGYEDETFIDLQTAEVIAPYRD